MPIIPFAEFLPDQPRYGNRGVVVAKNVYPSASGYLPVGALSIVTSATAARPRGAIHARDKDGNTHQYAGDAAKLYRNVSGTWTDTSLSGGYATGDEESWEFAAWKNKVLATNYSNNPQSITMGGTAFADLTSALKARHIASIRDFVVLANTTDAADGAVPHRVRWSAFNDETSWTVSASTLSDYQDLNTDAVQRVFGGEFGVVLQRNTVTRMTFVGAPVVFQFDQVLPGIGAIAPGACAQDGDVVYFLSRRGFIALVNGTQPNPIGANKIDSTVLTDLDENHLHRMSAVADPATHRVFWCYPGAGNVNGRPNKLVVYDRSLDRWAGPIEDELELIWSAGGIGYTLEGLDSISGSLDDLDISLDSSTWVGGAAEIAAFDDAFKSGFFSGSPMTGTLETGEMEIHSGHRTHLNAFRPLVNGGTVTAEVGTRNRQSDLISWGSSLSQRDSGRFVCRENARYHSFRYTLTGSWEQAIGQQIEPKEARKGEARG